MLKCNILKDYERHFYTNMISQFDSLSFIIRIKLLFQQEVDQQQYN